MNARDRRGVIHKEQEPYRGACGAKLVQLARGQRVTCRHCEGLMLLRDGTYSVPLDNESRT